ncbi:MAG TPA: PilZ domain-containing protein [Gammaproteobacteria bacterium]|nr:PilZ domain-containing protein [Gammaproteobacteria bacterium]
MRQYIRHPFDVTIRYTVGEIAQDGEELKNISEGGLCFHSPAPIAVGSRIHIEIPLEGQPFEADGIVVWCRGDADYEVGVRLDEGVQNFNLRMVEQLCHIKHYRQEVRTREGRELSYDQAALEWIGKYAKLFPR